MSTSSLVAATPLRAPSARAPRAASTARAPGRLNAVPNDRHWAVTLAGAAGVVAGLHGRAARAEEAATAQLDLGAPVEDVAAAMKEAAANIQEAVADVAAAATAVSDAAVAAAAAAPAPAPQPAAAASAVQQAAAAAQDVALPSIKAADLSAVKASLEEVQRALSDTLASNGVDAESLASTANQAAGLAQQAYTFLTTSEPTTLAEIGAGIVAAYYLLPPLGKAWLDALRGYAGEVPPTTALDALASQPNNALVDIRPVQDKESGGVPDLADSSKLVELEYVTVGDKVLQGRLRSPANVEAESTAVQLANLKNLNQGMTLYLMDGAGSQAKAVARELGRRGFGKVFVVTGGYGAWTAAKLKTRRWEAVPSTIKAVQSAAV